MMEGSLFLFFLSYRVGVRLEDLEVLIAALDGLGQVPLGLGQADPTLPHHLGKKKEKEKER